MNTYNIHSLESLETRTLLTAATQTQPSLDSTDTFPESSTYENFISVWNNAFSNGLAMNTKNMAVLPMLAYNILTPGFRQTHPSYFKTQDWTATTIDSLSSFTEIYHDYTIYKQAQVDMNHACPQAQAGLTQHAAQCQMSIATADKALKSIYLNAEFCLYTLAEYLSHMGVSTASNSINSVFPLLSGAGLAYVGYHQFQNIKQTHAIHQQAHAFIQDYQEDPFLSQSAKTIASFSLPNTTSYLSLAELGLKTISFVIWGCLGLESVKNLIHPSSTATKLTFANYANLLGMATFWAGSALHQCHLAASSSQTIANIQLEDTLTGLCDKLKQEGNTLSAHNGFELVNTTTGKFLSQLSISAADLWGSYHAPIPSCKQMLQHKLHLN